VQFADYSWTLALRATQTIPGYALHDRGLFINAIA
jgi:hypothetical protein